MPARTPRTKTFPLQRRRTELQRHGRGRKSGLLPKARGCHRTTSRYEGRCAQRDWHRSSKDHWNRTGTPLREKKTTEVRNRCSARPTEEREEAKREPKRRPVRIVRTVRWVGWSKRYVRGAGAQPLHCAVASAKPPGTYERVRIPAIEQGRARRAPSPRRDQERPRQDFGAHGT